ncbi:MAG: hypothetical protein ACLUHE_09445 [Christensenellales bacterium]
MKKTYIAVIIALMLALFSVSALAEETANHILTVYFSVAENSEVDVSSAASVTQWNGNAVGTISVLANMIHDHVGGDSVFHRHIRRIPRQYPHRLRRRRAGEERAPGADQSHREF